MKKLFVFAFAFALAYSGYAQCEKCEASYAKEAENAFCFNASGSHVVWPNVGKTLDEKAADMVFCRANWQGVVPICLYREVVTLCHRKSLEEILATEFFKALCNVRFKYGVAEMNDIRAARRLIK